MVLFADAVGSVCFPEFTFRETTFQTFLCLFVFRKVGQRKTLSGQRKTFSSQRKIWLGFQKSVFQKIWAETLSRSCEKFRNVIICWLYQI